MLRRFAAGLAEVMKMEYDDRRQQVTDRLLLSSFNLWSALLTVNGIFLAGFSAVYAVSPAVGMQMVLALIVACFISLFLLIYNFMAIKITYYRIGQLVTDEGDDLSEGKRKRDISKAFFRHRFIAVSEMACFLLLLVEAGLVIAIVLGVWNHG